MTVTSSENGFVARARVILPLHPRTAQALRALATKPFSKDVTVTAPLGYLETAWLLGHCRMLITDSGGMQKEAFFYGKPCVTLREETEWVELVEIGANQLVSPESEDGLAKINNAMEVLVVCEARPYGVGKAGVQITAALLAEGIS